jgi:tRNA pseudouridine38-40 synthase
VQSTIEEAIFSITGERSTVIGSGRTDAGAHARGQVVAFDTPSPLPTDVLLRALNANLPFDIAVTEVREVPSDFHPRLDAAARVYRYVMWNRGARSPFWWGRAAHVKARLDERMMHEAAQLLVGRHDFSAFVAASAEGDRGREVYRARCWREGDLVLFEIEANGFMKQMVRAIAGTLIRVGLGKVSASELPDILASLDRDRAGDTAPADGLYLIEVKYPESQTISEPESAGRSEEQS